MHPRGEIDPLKTFEEINGALAVCKDAELLSYRTIFQRQSNASQLGSKRGRSAKDCHATGLKPAILGYICSAHSSILLQRPVCRDHHSAVEVGCSRGSKGGLT